MMDRRATQRQLIWIGLGALLIVSMLLVACGGQPEPSPGPSAAPSPGPGLTGNLVIASHVGEVTQETRCVGEQIRYRIYYQNDSAGPADIVITDGVPSALSELVPLDDGQVDQATRTITWKVADVSAGGGGHVEFAALIGDAPVISNQATLTREGGDSVWTNAVETRVCGRPDTGWVPFTPQGKEGQPPQAYMKEQTTTGVMVNFDVPGMFVHEQVVGNVTYHRLSIPGHATLTEEGKPELPILGQLIEVPFGVDFEVEVYQSASVSLEGYNVYPSQIQWNTEDAPEVFTIDGPAYQADEMYPGDLATVQMQDVGVMRGHRLVFLKVNPVQYNPVTREIEAYSQIEVRLSYSRLAQVEPIEGRLRSAAFESMLQRAVLNYLDLDRFNSRDVSKDTEAVDYLIITHGDFNPANDPNNPVVELENWKRQKGYRTKVLDVADIPGNQTAADIRSYLLNAYQTWDPPPTYVLLVGDSEFIPTTHRTPHTFAAYNGAETGTDLYYAALDGGDSDYFPDLFIGRLPVDTLAQARVAIGKILDYEQNPPAGATFYTDATLIALFEDDTDPTPPGSPPDAEPEDGREDRPWIENIEEVREYLENNNYNAERIYATSSGWPGDPGSSQPASYRNGTPLPVDLTVNGNPGAGIPGFGWNGDTDDINTAIGNGTFLITYRDHGSRGAWSGFIGFNRGDVDNLTNGNLTPVLLSLACENGWFDNETDAAGLNTGNNSESFGEHWIRNGNGGAVAFVGASRVSSTGWNDFLMFGMHQAIWPGFDPAPPTTGYPAIPDITSSPLPRMGQVLVFGQVYMANAYTDSSIRLEQFELYHLFGDPEMPIWTEQPAALKVDHPAGIGATGTQDFIVRVTDAGSGDPVQNAVVTLNRDNTTLAAGQTNPAGLARFTLAHIGSGDIQLTATALNFQPYQGVVEVAARGAQINRLDPEDGIAGSAFLLGGTSFSGSEEVQITFDGQFITAVTASSGGFGQAGTADLSITVPAGQPLGPVNVLAHGQSSGRYGVDVFTVRTANPIDLYTYSQWDSSTWTMTPGSDPVWDSPDIQVYDGGTPVPSNSLTAGHDYTFKATIHNDTAFQAQNVQVTFMWANFGVGQDRVWEDAGTDTLDVPGNSVRQAQITWAPPGTGHLCIKVVIYHVEDINETNNQGQENLHVGPTSSPAEVPFVIFNPTDRPVAVYLEVRQLITRGEEGQEPLWGISIKQPDPQILLPGESREAVLIFDPEWADVGPGAIARFVLTASVDGEIIGGAQFQITIR
jgi:hypothetical protein